MLPMMARDFHRITLSGPLVNLAAVPLTGVIVPLGFVTLATGILLPAFGKILAAPLASLTMLLIRIVQWFAHFPRWSYRIPGPPFFLLAFFFIAAVLLAGVIRWKRPLRGKITWALCAALTAGALSVAIYPFGPQWMWYLPTGRRY
jgi:Competence protein